MCITTDAVIEAIFNIFLAGLFLILFAIYSRILIWAVEAAFSWDKKRLEKKHPGKYYRKKDGSEWFPNDPY